MIIIAFLGFATLGITLALLLKKLFSGPDLGWVKTLICITCNVYFSACYLHLINHEQFVYFDGRTYRLDDHPLIGWLSMLLVLFHGLAYPRKL